MEVEYKNTIENMEKSDLHVHINGAVPTQTLIELATNMDLKIPSGFDIKRDLQILEPVESLREYFKPWTLFKMLPIGYECLSIMVESTFKNLALDNVKYVEFRNSPFYISVLNNISLEEALLWLIELIKKYSSIYKIEGRLILSLTRHELVRNQMRDLLKAIKNVNYEGYIVGVDMSGDEEVPVPRSFSSFFRKAKEELGLGITIHAGETGNLENIEWAIKECNADRIGHGNAAANSPKVLNLIKENDVCLEVCLISNLRTGYCKGIEDHSLHTFLKWDIPFVLCTDNPAVHGVSLSKEYLFFISNFNRVDIINQMLGRNRRYSFS